MGVARLEGRFLPPSLVDDGESWCECVYMRRTLRCAASRNYQRGGRQSARANEERANPADNPFAGCRFWAVRLETVDRQAARVCAVCLPPPRGCASDGAAKQRLHLGAVLLFHPAPWVGAGKWPPITLRALFYFARFTLFPFVRP